MNREIPLPLNEPQQRHITVALAGLEGHLAELRERLERPPRDSRMVHHDDPVNATEAEKLLPLIAEAETQLRHLADDLQLEAQTEPARRAFITALEFASIHLYECQPEHGLNGYGKVAPATAEYLEREIPKLDAAVHALIARLQQTRTSSHVTR